MTRKPVVIREADLAWETHAEDRAAARKGVFFWKTLISADRTESYALSMGLGRIPPDERLNRHRHPQPEAYFVLERSGVVDVDGEEHLLGPGSAVFIPGGATHGLRNSGSTDLRYLYAFPVDAVRYRETVYEGDA